MIKEIHIYDLDGTVIDSSHRYRYIIGADGWRAIDFPYWVENRYRAANDKLLPLAKQYQNQRRDPSVFLVAATSRAMVEVESKHVYNVLGWPDHMISRTEGDMQSGATLKIDGLKKLFQKKPELSTLPGFFYEDNTDYLNAVCNEFNFSGIYVPSKQGY